MRPATPAGVEAAWERWAAALAEREGRVSELEAVVAQCQARERVWMATWRKCGEAGG